ncbi:hypothetical protein GYB22_12655 [bacterium]|nr:hypothetical protein [bacterium]
MKNLKDMNKLERESLDIQLKEIASFYGPPIELLKAHLETTYLFKENLIRYDFLYRCALKVKSEPLLNSMAQRRDVSLLIQFGSKFPLDETDVNYFSSINIGFTRGMMKKLVEISESTKDEMTTGEKHYNEIIPLIEDWSSVSITDGKVTSIEKMP